MRSKMDLSVVSTKKMQKTQKQAEFLKQSRFVQSFVNTLQTFNIPTEFENDDMDRVAFFHNMTIDEEEEPMYYARITNIEDRPGMSYVRMG